VLTRFGLRVTLWLSGPLPGRFAGGLWIGLPLGVVGGYMGPIAIDRIANLILPPLRKRSAEGRQGEAGKEQSLADFLDKLKKGIDKGITTVSVRSKETFATSRLRRQIKVLAKEKRERLEELGNIVYTFFTRGELDAGQERVKEKSEALMRLDEQIQEKEEEIRQIQLKAQEALGKISPPPQDRME